VVGEEEGEMFTLSKHAFEKILLSNPEIGDLIRKTASERKSQE
jgi:CRP-like cAMP-binding protein